MVKKETSPEEKLLSLIKNKNKAAVPVQVQQAPQSASKSKPAETVMSKADERLDGMLKSEIFKSKFFEPAALNNINKYLIVILAVLILYFMIDLIVVRPAKNVQSIIAKAKGRAAARSSGRTGMFIVLCGKVYKGEPIATRR